MRTGVREDDRVTDPLPHPATGELFGSPVPPGTGWPGDPASPSTPVAGTAAQVRRLARVDGLAELDARVSVCRACPRLVRWREDVARAKRASFATEPYWGRPVPGWGATDPRILVVGLAPAANGANRTGRIFTGDRSGDWLFASLHRVGLARAATSTHAADGQELIGTRMIATVRCAPPQNKPTVLERDTCTPWMLAELDLVLETVEVVVALGSFGWDATLRSFAGLGWPLARPRPRFGHGVEARLVGPDREVTLLGCYHPSQHNTFSGRLTEVMVDDVLRRAAVLGRITG
jgi:uracil-DNA glycosylase